MRPHDQTRPSSPRVQFEQAINLAKAGQKTEAYALLRDIVALQPVNQAAWLWLSAVASTQTEAEAALAQARRINPAHPALIQAEQWLIHHFSTAPVTQKTPIVDNSVTIAQRPPVEPLRPPPTKKSVAPATSQLPKTVSQAAPGQADCIRPGSTISPLKASPLGLPPNLFTVFNSLAFSLAILATLIGLCALFLGLVWQLKTAIWSGELPADTAQAQGASPAENTEPGDNDMLALTELEQAWLKQDWSRAVAILENLHQLKPTSQPIKDRLTQAQIQMGIALRRRGFVEESLPSFRRALEITPGQLQAQQEFQLASTYLTAIEHYQAGQWQEVAPDLERIWARDKDYNHIKDLLYSAYYNQALALQAVHKLPEARTALESAIALHPELSAPRRLMAELEFALAPQTPPPFPVLMTPLKDRNIVVGIAEQRMWVYEGKKKVFDFVVSTGEPGRETAVGEFEIQNKIDVAYASTWNLDMPYWMGIYWAGPLQNGIHALPIVKHTGYKLWDGYLGQRVSYGCVILSDEDAATLYDWAEVGVKVKIVPSLAQWSSIKNSD